VSRSHYTEKDVTDAIFAVWAQGYEHAESPTEVLFAALERLGFDAEQAIDVCFRWTAGDGTARGHAELVAAMLEGMAVGVQLARQTLPTGPEPAGEVDLEAIRARILALTGDVPASVTE